MKKKSAKWPKNIERKSITLLVTCDNDDNCKYDAHAITEDILKLLREKNAPIFIPDGEVMYKVTDKSHKNLIINNTKDLKNDEVMVLSFLNSHSIENYQDIREYCLTNGIISQCIDISYSGMKKKQKNMGPIIDNIMTQIVNKFGHLLWWAPYESMPESFQLKKF